MKTLVIFYSLTGNNEALAKSIAAEFSAEYIKVIESHRRTVFTIVFDMLFNRMPPVQPMPDNLEKNDWIIFIGPVWFGCVATPLRAYFDNLKGKLNKYVFISISGGAAGPNPKLAEELTKRTGKEPSSVINLYIADLLPVNPKPTMKDTSAYRLNDKDVKTLTDIAAKKLREIIVK